MAKGGIGRAIGLQGVLDVPKSDGKAEADKIKAAADARKARDKAMADIQKDIVNNADLEPHWRSKAGSATASTIGDLLEVYEDPTRNMQVEGAELLRKWTEVQSQYKTESDQFRKYRDADPDRFYKNQAIIDMFENPENIGDDSKMRGDPMFGATQYHDKTLPDEVGYGFQADPKFDYDAWLKQNITAEDFSETVNLPAERLPKVGKYRYGSYRKIPESMLDPLLDPLRTEGGFIESAQKRYTRLKRAKDPDWNLGDDNGVREDSKAAMDWALRDLRDNISKETRGHTSSIQAKKAPKSSFGFSSSRSPWGVKQKYQEDSTETGDPNALGLVTGITFTRSTKAANSDYNRIMDIRGGFYDKEKSEWVTTGEAGKFIPVKVKRLVFGMWNGGLMGPSWGLSVITEAKYTPPSGTTAASAGYVPGKGKKSGWNKKSGSIQQYIIPVSDVAIQEMQAETGDVTRWIPTAMKEQEKAWYDKQNQTPIRFKKSHVEASAKTRGRTYEEEVSALRRFHQKKGRTISITDDGGASAKLKEKRIARSVIKAKAKAKGYDYDKYVQFLTEKFLEKGETLIIE